MHVSEGVKSIGGRVDAWAGRCLGGRVDAWAGRCLGGWVHTGVSEGVTVY